MKFKSTELRGFLTGLLIGDAYIDKGISKRAFCIKNTNKDFIDLIAKEVEENTSFSYYIKEIPAHYSCGCNHKISWELRIKAHPYFRKIYSSFYDDYRHRIITLNVTKWLTPYGIACWFMSDGYCCLIGRNKGVITDRRIDFCTDAYSKYQVEMLQDMFKNKYNIETSIIKRDNFYRIRIKKQSYRIFIELISPYIVDSMKYKLYLGYTNKQDWMSDEIWEQQQIIYSAITLTSNIEG